MDCTDKHKHILYVLSHFSRQRKPLWVKVEKKIVRFRPTLKNGGCNLKKIVLLHMRRQQKGDNFKFFKKYLVVGIVVIPLMQRKNPESNSKSRIYSCCLQC